MVRKAGPRQLEFRDAKCDTCSKHPIARDEAFNYLCQKCALEIIKKNQCIKL
tara:strand:+ start:506 stop:661 length:156 start_codon:yes stop_codon:yes gene_type:complete